MSNNTDAKAALGGNLMAYGGEPTVNNLTDLVVPYRKALDASAAAAVADKFWVNPFPFPLRIVSAVISPDGTVALSANAAGISINVADAAGNQATAAWWSTASGVGMVPSGAPTGTVGTGFAANVPQQATGVPTASTVQPGGALSFNTQKLSSGVTLSALSASILMRRV